MTTRFIGIWQPSYTREVLDELFSGNSDIERIVIFQAVEWEVTQLCGQNDLVYEVVDYCSSASIETIIVTSTLDRLDMNRVKSATVIYIPAAWIAKQLHSAATRDGSEILSKNQNLDNDIEHLYVNLNHWAHDHRCRTMDELAKHNLIELGKISWADKLHRYQKNRNEIPDSIRSGYPYKYWSPVRMALDDEFQQHFHWDKIPKECNSAFVHLVTESTLTAFFFTEKTSKAILYNKFFLSVAPVNFHQTLKDLGFVLYENLFDYSFDSEPNMNKRIEMIVSNIDRYRNHSMKELTEIRNNNKDKLYYNKSRALELTADTGVKLEFLKPYITTPNVGTMSDVSTLINIQEVLNRVY